MRVQATRSEPAVSGSPPSIQAPPNARAVLRVSIAFLLRTLDSISVTMDNDVVQSLIYTYVWSANVQQLIGTDDDGRYSGFMEIPPDELRRPVSVLAVADSLYLPYETVRRKVEQLIRTGACVRVGRRGVIVPAAAHLRPNQAAAAREWLANLRRYTDALRRCGVYVSQSLRAEPPTATADDFPPNIRPLLRVGAEYFLRSAIFLVESIDRDFISGVIYTAIWSANVSRITNSSDNTEYGGVDDVPPDSLRCPVSVLALANSLRLPHETVRRYVCKLEKDGLCVRVKEGLIVPAAVHEREEFRVTVAAFLPRVYRFLSDLKRVGYDFG